MVTKKQIKDIELWIKSQKDEEMHRLVCAVDKDFGFTETPNGLAEIQIKLELDSHNQYKNYKKKENKYKRIIIHRICKEPLEFDSFGNWKCKKCNKVKRYKFDDKELEIIEDGS